MMGEDEPGTITIRAALSYVLELTLSIVTNGFSMDTKMRKFLS